MLAIKRIYACYQTNFCLLSNELLFAVNNTQPLTLHLMHMLQHGQPYIS